MKRLMREEMYDDPRSWLQTTFENDQLKLKALEHRVKEYFLELETKYQVRLIYRVFGYNVIIVKV